MSDANTQTAESAPETTADTLTSEAEPEQEAKVVDSPAAADSSAEGAVEAEASAPEPNAATEGEAAGQAAEEAPEPVSKGTDAAGDAAQTAASDSHAALEAGAAAAADAAEGEEPAAGTRGDDSPAAAKTETAAKTEAAANTEVAARTDEATAEPSSAAQPASGAENSAAENSGATEKADVSSPSSASDGSQEKSGSKTTIDTSGAAAQPQPMSPELEQLKAAMESQERLAGKVIGWNKGGFHVAVLGVAAFCPKSQMELGNPKKAAAYLDRDLEFRVLEIKEDGKRVVVSRIPVLKEDRTRILADLREKMQSKEPLEGTVRSVTDFGAFVALGAGLEGLVHRSQITRKRFDDTREVIAAGQPVRVVVLKIDKGGERISLSMKALEDDPWKGLDEKLSIGDAFTGTIVRKADFGLFVEVLPGVEGLLHESQLPIGKKMSEADYEEGKAVEGWIREVEPDRNRLSLSLREVAATNPWLGIGERYTEGQQIEGTVEQIANFGVFVQIEPGLTGLLPASSTGVAAGGRLDRMYRPGNSVKVVIDSIDTKRKRMSLALPGAKLEGTKADLREYQKKQQKDSSSPSLNAMAAAFERLKGSSS